MFARMKKPQDNKSAEVKRRESCADDKLQCAVKLLSDTIDAVVQQQRHQNVASFKAASMRHP